MKKIKSLKTISSLATLAAVTPVVATACNEDETIEKTDIGSIHWSTTGNYNSAMTSDEFITEFVKNNPAGQNDIPEGIYENINMEVSGSFANWTFNLSAIETSTKFKGSTNVNVVAQIDVKSLNWSTSGNYNAEMTRSEILTMFKDNNKAGEHNLPADVYDNVDVTNDSVESKWIISIKVKDTSTTYVGQMTLSTTYKSTMTYDNQEHELADNINPDLFITSTSKGEWITQRIPLKNGDEIAIGGSADNWNKLTVLKINSFDNTNTAIGNYFLKECKGLTTLYLPEINNLKTMGDDMLYDCTSLSTFDLRPFQNFTTIGANFLGNCSSLPKDIDFSPIYNVTQLGGLGLPQLESFDLTKFTKLTAISGGFLSGCSKLTNLNLKPLRKVTKIAANFLNNCTSLPKDIDFSPIYNVKELGGLKLSQLETFDLTKFTNLEVIHTNFLSATQIKTIDFSQCSKLTTIDNYVLYNCANLETITLPNLDSLTTIGNYFCSGCAKLQSIDLTKMPILGKIGSHFLYECETLTSLKFPVTWKINTFNTAFLSGCKNIKSLAFPKQWTITSSIASDFLRNCSSLENLDLPHDWVVSAVGANFLYKCSKLKSVDVSCLYSITEFADNFLAECSNLTKIERLPTLIYETKIGNNFCLNCKSLEEIDFTSIEMVESIGKSFMQGCEKIPLVDLTPMPRLLKDNVIGENFLYNCKNLTELKIATIPATAFVKNTYSFATDDQTSPMYKRPGIKIIGDHANELKIAFPNSNSAPYRKWQENLTITAKHGEDPIEQSTLVEVTDNDTIQFSISKGTSPAWSVNPEEGVSIDSSGKLTITTAPENEKVYRVTCICDEGVAEFNMILVKDDTPPIQKVNYIVFQNRKIVIEGALTQSDIDAMCTTGYDLIIKGTKYDKMDINEIYFNDIDSNVTTIGENFLFEIFYATSINIASFTNVKSIGNFCMQDCWEAKDVTLPEMWNVETIGSDFLSGNEKVESIVLPYSPNITSIGKNFLTYCPELINVDMKDIPASVLSVSDSSFSVSKQACTAFKTGITLRGIYKSQIQEKFPERLEDYPYRNWYDAK